MPEISEALEASGGPICSYLKPHRHVAEFCDLEARRWNTCAATTPAAGSQRGRLQLKHRAGDGFGWMGLSCMLEESLGLRLAP